MDNSKGRYWDKPWGLVSSCSRCSPGCEHCWALAMEKRFHKGIEGQIVTHPERLDIPLRTRKPTVFSLWNDLFHEDVPDEFIFQTFETICSCRGRHTFLILTKRPQRMAECLNKAKEYCPTWFTPDGRFDLWGTFFGCTVCNQPEADAKIPELLKVPGRKFLSIEPMLGPIEIGHLLNHCPEHDYAGGFCLERRHEGVQWIDAVVLGGETGPGARPLHPDWVRSVRDQCEAAGVAFYLKQRGEFLTIPEAGDLGIKTDMVDLLNANSLGGGFLRVGKKRSGRLLDGRTHDELAWGNNE